MVPKYYIDEDRVLSRVFIACSEKSELGPYLIECSKAYQARELVKKLNSGTIKGPDGEPDLYHHQEDLTRSMGVVKVFSYKGN